MNEDESIEIGEFKISRLDERSFFIQRQCGEGMQVSEAKLELLIEEYFAANF